MLSIAATLPASSLNATFGADAYKENADIDFADLVVAPVAAVLKKQIPEKKPVVEDMAPREENLKKDFSKQTQEASPTMTEKKPATTLAEPSEKEPGPEKEDAQAAVMAPMPMVFPQSPVLPQIAMPIIESTVDTVAPIITQEPNTLLQAALLSDGLLPLEQLTRL
jgi:hypothetical protein